LFFRPAPPAIEELARENPQTIHMVSTMSNAESPLRRMETEERLLLFAIQRGKYHRSRAHALLRKSLGGPYSRGTPKARSEPDNLTTHSVQEIQCEDIEDFEEAQLTTPGT